MSASLEVTIGMTADQIATIVTTELNDMINNPAGIAKKDLKALKRVAKWYTPYVDEDEDDHEMMFIPDDDCAYECAMCGQDMELDEDGSYMFELLDDDTEEPEW